MSFHKTVASRKACKIVGNSTPKLQLAKAEHFLREFAVACSVRALKRQLYSKNVSFESPQKPKVYQRSPGN